ncbi:2-hydroxyacyl-CoA dehydratase subunit D [Desulfoferrobacter suflitae]|uniref:2-hydroxyacyl-CoA dehydratase subunit D n=1 Tax=Desulfoferrobacter suflitae TaxID=2865782 RepID=UPI002164C683|nr:2-hydroxyacyl-CoA dehydratase family protein [Desulfoferrobacter suflitae]MCK8603695.1 2-hydroxyacyl-CoA dehydratase family protein [Desulfoferrobacter suflitae]
MTRFRFETCQAGPDSRRIGWVCSYTPEELIMAAGFVPHRIESGEANAEGADAFLPANLCPYVRGLLGAALSGRCDGLHGVVLVASCDAMRRLADIWTIYVGARFIHRLDVPRRSDNLAEVFFAEQLRVLRSALEREAGRAIENDDIARTIETTNETRRLISRISLLRADAFSPLSGSEFAVIARCAAESDKERFNAEAKRFLSAFGERAEKQSERPRILLCGSIVNGCALQKLIEDAGGAVVADDLCTGLRHYDGLVDASPDPLRGIARRYLRRAGCARMKGAEARIRRLLGLAKEHGAAGVVYHTLKFCDLVQADLPRLREALRQEGIPLLHVDRDGASAAGGQLTTRVEAFVELLDKGGRQD